MSVHLHFASFLQKLQLGVLLFMKNTKTNINSLNAGRCANTTDDQPCLRDCLLACLFVAGAYLDEGDAIFISTDPQLVGEDLLGRWRSDARRNLQQSFDLRFNDLRTARETLRHGKPTELGIVMHRKVSFVQSIWQQPCPRVRFT